MNVTNTRRLRLEDLGLIDLNRLVIVSQDHWQRILRNLDKKHPDFLAISTRLSKIVSAGSCKYNPAFASTTPIALHQEAAHAATTMTASLLAVIDEFSVRRSDASREERSDALLRQAGAVVAQRPVADGAATAALERGPSTAAAVVRAQGVVITAGPDVDPLFEPRTLTAAASFISVSCDIVSCFSLANLGHVRLCLHSQQRSIDGAYKALSSSTTT